ncbi:hypothetical protein [Streptomyces beigongshangae]|uniref:hypothetical protein n=1 Tax=Streptomyces beigongshangae TaxID=2841597 RepID=UPI001C86190A|nr:hypothetical protein [Streptomyces sp. REN17]
MAVALVSGFRRWGAGGGTAVTRGPVGRDARCTGRACGASPDAVPGTVSAESADATGSTRAGGSSPGTGPADVVSAFLISPPGAPSSTAWDRVPVRDGFCQVLSRPPNPESATPGRPVAARWIGGSPAQPTTATGPGVGVGSGPGSGPGPGVGEDAAAEDAAAEDAAEDAAAEVGAAVPPLSRSKNPTDQPSAPPRVTRDAICSV